MDNSDNFAVVQDRADLQVLMLGGRRCGKTAVLASMFHAAKHGAANEYLTFSDCTVLKTKGVETQDPLSGKTSELLDLLSRPNTSTFLVDQKPSKYWWDYRLKIQTRGTNRDFHINFRDVPGEYFRAGNKHQEEVSAYIKQCAVFIVVVDTPYLMESANPENLLCNDGHNMQVNRLEEIQSFLTNINEENSQAKMVIFCPVKCEKWYNSGRIGDVNKRLREVYNTAITDLTGYKKMDISIIPVLTAGNIEFVEQKEAFLLIDNPKNFRLDKIRNKEGVVRCCRQSSKLLRLEDGRPYSVKESDIVNEDPDAALIGSNLIRPFSWFKTRFLADMSLNGFHPVNCEQLVLHITRFMLAKHDQERNFFGWLKEVFGGIDPKELKKIINEMQIKGIIKDSKECGIEHIKSAF